MKILYFKTFNYCNNGKFNKSRLKHNQKILNKINK